MNKDRNPELLGRKVFFLYPHSVIQNDMINILINYEYEVYSINDHEKMLKLSEKYPESILFINIDDKLDEEEWESYINKYINNEKMISRIGILTYNKDKNLAEKYLMDIMVPCGFIVLSLSLRQSAVTILKTLKANEAKGRRKFLRAADINSENSKLNFKYNGSLYNGNISDISIAGMAITLSSDILIPVNTHLQDIQLQLKGIICRVSGIVAAHRNQNGSFVLMFRDIDELSAAKIHNYIQNRLQFNMSQIISKI